MQQKTQCDPDESRRGEAPNPAPSGAETALAQPERESPSYGQVHPAGGDAGDCAGRTKMETHNHVSGGQVVPGGGTITKRMRCPAVSMTIHTEHPPPDIACFLYGMQVNSGKSGVGLKW